VPVRVLESLVELIGDKEQIDRPHRFSGGDGVRRYQSAAGFDDGVTGREQAARLGQHCVENGQRESLNFLLRVLVHDGLQIFRNDSTRCIASGRSTA
jgi:hypothetical protein